MRKGDFETAWAVNDQEGQHWPSAHQFWNGEPFQRTAVELEARHGLGDFVQMMRFVPMLNQFGCTVTVNVRPELQSLAVHFAGKFTTNVMCDRPAKHQSLEMMELPYALRLQCRQLPMLTNYLHVPSGVAAQKRSQINNRDGAPKIGIVWSGSSWDPERWIPFGYLLPLFDLTCCEWWSMQGAVPAPFCCHPRVKEFGRANSGTLVEFAAAVQALDLLITVDTLAAHIAGALGKEVWVLLKKQADWRWMQNRTDSPWYPSMRLFRQQDAGNWTGVLSAVETELAKRYAVRH